MMTLDMIWRFADCIIAAVLLVVHIVAWRKNTPVVVASADVKTEKELGASTVLQASTGGLTAVSILIPATQLIAVDASMKIHHQIGTGWLLLSLLVASWLLFTLPMHAHKRSVAGDGRVGGLLFPQLLFLFLGVFRLALGFFLSSPVQEAR